MTEPVGKATNSDSATSKFFEMYTNQTVCSKTDQRSGQNALVEAPDRSTPDHQNPSPPLPACFDTLRGVESGKIYSLSKKYLYMTFTMQAENVKKKVQKM